MLIASIQPTTMASYGQEYNEKVLRVHKLSFLHGVLAGAGSLWLMNKSVAKLL
jgi:hypothetical protein